MMDAGVERVASIASLMARALRGDSRLFRRVLVWGTKEWLDRSTGTFPYGSGEMPIAACEFAPPCSTTSPMTVPVAQSPVSGKIDLLALGALFLSPVSVNGCAALATCLFPMVGSTWATALLFIFGAILL